MHPSLFLIYDKVEINGLRGVDVALEDLVNNPQKLERERDRFNRPPPQIRSPAGSTTVPDTPQDYTEEDWRADQRVRLSYEHNDTRAYTMFHKEVERELSRCFKDLQELSRHVPNREHDPLYWRKQIKKRWVKQGIWNDNWNCDSSGGWLWAHEEPLEPEPELPTIPEHEMAEERSDEEGYNKNKSNEQYESEDDEETRKMKKARALQEHKREASRPIHQFIYQLSEEQQRLQQQSRLDGNTAADPLDINTTAYEKVKETWTKKKIWDSRWGLLPGMCWHHETPAEEWIEHQLSMLTFPRPPTPAYQQHIDFNEENLMPFLSVSNTPPEPNQENHPSPYSPPFNGDQQVEPMVIDAPEALDMTHHIPSRHTSPPPPPVEKRRPGRPRRRSEKPTLDSPPPRSPVQLRRSKRLQETKVIAALDTATAGKGRPRRGASKADGLAPAVPARNARALKRRDLKQKRSQKA